MITCYAAEWSHLGREVSPAVVREEFEMKDATRAGEARRAVGSVMGPAREGSGPSARRAGSGARSRRRTCAHDAVGLESRLERRDRVNECGMRF